MDFLSGFNADMFLDELDEQNNKVNYSLVDKSIAIGSIEGGGKTATINELINMLREQTGNKNIARVCSLDPRDRYGEYENFPVFNPPLYNWGSTDKNAVGEILQQKPDHISRYEHLKLFADYFIEAKKQNPDFPVKVLVFDSLTKVERYAMEYILETARRKYKKPEMTGNQYSKQEGTRGAIYIDTGELIFSEIIERLKEAGYTLWYTWHLKEKKKKVALTDEEYSYYSSKNTTGIFSRFLEDLTYSFILEDPSQVKNGGIEVSTRRILRCRPGNGYHGAKATAEMDKIPETIDVTGQNSKMLAATIQKLIIDSLKGDLTDEEFEAKRKQQEKEDEERKKRQADRMNKLKQVEAEKAEFREKCKQTVQFITEKCPPENAEAWMTYFKGFAESYNCSDMMVVMETQDIEILNIFIDAVNPTWGEVEGFPKLEKFQK